MSIAVIIAILVCPSCGKKTENLQQEVKVMREENNFLKAENVALKKEIEELYKRIEEKELARLKTQQKPESDSLKQIAPEKVEKPESVKTKRPVNGSGR